MGIFLDIKKSILKHTILRYLHYTELDADICRLLSDKQVELALMENERLRQSLRKATIENVIGEEQTAGFIVNGKPVQLNKQEIVELAVTYHEAKIKRSNDAFSPEDIVGITIDDSSITRFRAHYFDGENTYIYKKADEKYTLYFSLFNLNLLSYDPDKNVLTLINSHAEKIRLPIGTVVTNDFLKKFSKGKQYIQQS